MPPILARPKYTKLPVPTSYSSQFLATEFGNVQRAIPSVQVRIIFGDDRPTTNDSVILCDATSGPITITLQDPSLVQGLVLTIKKIDSTGNAVTIIAQVDNASNPTLSSQYKSITLVAVPGMYAKIASV